MKCPHCETHIDEHEANRCLNIWVAEMVMDEKQEMCPIHQSYSCCGRHLKNYSTQIADAWMVVEYFKERQYKVEIVGEDGFDWSYWTCKIYSPIGHEVLGGATVEEYHEPTAPEAICKAALKASIND